MAKTTSPKLFVVDGSNIATEGRSTPSLAQLDEAVRAFLDEFPDANVTVVVDATFGHRIAKKEVKAFDEAVANNELVTPPAGAIGRGDAFVLSIANKAQAGVLSNDSFQEFHGEYEWLFEEGRLIGGKPVPHVGWVFVSRTPVRGPKSRQAVRDAKQDTGADPTATKQQAKRRVRKKKAAAAEPATTASAKRGKAAKAGAAERADDEQRATIEAAKQATPPKSQVNELVPFLEFVEHHPVGTSCTGVVESYSSHGAYVRIDEVLLYVPLRLMDDPPPRSARAAMTIGEAVTVVIVGYVPDRRSIDAALPHMAADVAIASEPAPAPKKTAARKRRTPAKKTAAKKTAAKKTAAKKTAAKKTPAKKTPAKKTAAKKTPAKKAATKKTPAKKTAAKKTAAKTPAKKTPAKKTAAKKTAAKQTAAKKTPAKRARKR